MERATVAPNWQGPRAHRSLARRYNADRGGGKASLERAAEKDCQLGRLSTTRSSSSSTRPPFSSVGFGSTQHLTGELLAQFAGIKFMHVPYRGGMQPLTDLIGGQIDLIVDTITVTGQAVNAGTLTGLWISSAQPWPTLPQVQPIAAELSGSEVKSRVGLAALARTPPDIVASSTLLSPKRSSIRNSGRNWAYSESMPKVHLRKRWHHSSHRKASAGTTSSTKRAYSASSRRDRTHRRCFAFLIFRTFGFLDHLIANRGAFKHPLI